MGGMTGRPRTATDEAVFAAVTRVVSDVGPGGLTLAAVAREVGVSAPALAQRFGSKRGLLLAYAAHAAGGVDDLIEQALATAPDPLSAVRAALLAFTAPITTRSALAHHLAFLHLDLTDPDLGALATKQSRALRRRIAALLREAHDRGQLTGVGPVALADAVYTAYNGALVTWAIDGRGSLARWVAACVDAVIAPYVAAARAPSEGRPRARPPRKVRTAGRPGAPGSGP